ncbi:MULTISPECIES: ribonuclease P protein component [Rhodobacterales]|uniref:ribonuclease P protein component n=1 Tax=Rhodobacterales TaxID=204455 RepID=UPI0032991F15
MTPSHSPLVRTTPEHDERAAVSLRFETLNKRADFQRASRALRVAMPGFVLQVRARHQDEAKGMRVGYTCSKKVGNAVARNRAKRRLREIARYVLPSTGRTGLDYVLIGRKTQTADLPFDQLQTDLRKAIDRLHARLT